MSRPVTIEIELPDFQYEKPSQGRLAAKDMIDGLRAWRLWSTLGWNDIVQRYRRSMLGPFWLTASMAIMVLALGIVYSRLFKTELHDFLPFLCVGLLLWGYVSATISEAGTLFTGSESYIKQIRLPYSIYAFRFIWSRIIILAHNFIIYFGVLIYFQFSPGLGVLMAIPALVLLTFNLTLTSLYLGMVSARFRDIPQIVGSVVQIAFFITPVMWKPELLGVDSTIVLLNPFFHLLEIVRAPLLGQSFPAESYIAVLILTIFNSAIAAAFFTRFRSRISYWI
ncbi:ABC transporter permease [Tardiphaga sp. P9-11]|uniref:ABC transporter permease n=1 Tax=Tardiphaga sp. P9-11 TaxID=2024614 RepID=UPI00156278D2|nr:ABC transporter permease [Tardiphaga sp. P9-11]